MLGKYSKTSNLIGNRIYDAQSYGFQTPKKSNSVDCFLVFFIRLLCHFFNLKNICLMGSGEDRVWELEWEQG